ncbi:hypothetical protein D9757_013640 [Collybiopsis confluens]|uniref:Uncharacterized protein n=1 Tax=Collybiopsis confluens TaxID=2823264 RepID=A0A8H5G8D4_9AGAR|nr:hypothetical protein D9757_013640 [Collybiopsis confluens]
MTSQSDNFTGKLIPVYLSLICSLQRVSKHRCLVRLNHSPTTYDTINPLHSDLSGKVILVTGASRGIGRAISIAYAQAGASGLALLARNRAGLIETRTACMKAQRHGSDKNFQVLLLEVGITSTEAVASALKEVETKFKRLDIVVNNAGQFQGHQNNIGDMDPGSWWNIWTVNVNGLFNVTRAALPLLLDGLRIIVNMTSITAHLITGGFSDYETSKLAILRLSQFIAAEYGDQGVLCYAIHPGTILTDMPAQIPKNGGRNSTLTWRIP